MSGYVAGNVTVEYRAAPRTPASWPHQVGVIPRETAAFQERDEAEGLRAALPDGGTAVLCQVLRGIGGVGKTQLAAHYARQAWNAGELDVLVWVGASSRSAIIAAYAQAAEELLAVEPGHPERCAQAFLKWLEPRPPGSEPACRWLVVLDDVADPADVTALWPVENPHGRTVVTTRRRDVAVPGQRIDLGVFTPDEAAAYVSTFLAEHGRHDDPGEIHALAQDLGYLPLALSQAAAYIVDAGIPIDCPACTHRQCPSYRRRLAGRTTTLASMLPEPGTLPDDQATTVAATWSLSVERADALRPVGLARPALHLAAMLDPDGIPQDVLTSRPARDHLTLHRTRDIPAHDHSGDVTEQDARDALRVLHRLNLITHDPDAPCQAVRTHQLIQRATRDTLTPDQRHQTARAAADALMTVWPDIERDTALAQTLRANTATLAAHAEEALHQPAPPPRRWPRRPRRSRRLRSDVHVVLYRTGRSIGEAGQVTAAIAHFHRLTETTTRHLGPHHPDTLAARHNLARWRGEAGDPTGAAAAFEELLADRIRVWGADHPETLTTRHNLAHWRGEAGDATGAATAYEELLADQVRVLGPDHSETLTTRHNLAQWRGEAGDAAAAATACEVLLAEEMHLRGAAHPQTLTTRHNLAHWRGEAGDVDDAAAAFEELLTDQVRVLGPDHPQTLTTRHNLARWRGKAGDAAGAAAAYKELLADRLRVLGPDHPDTLNTRNSLAHWRGEEGDAAGAAAAFDTLLADQVRVLGPDHPDTLTTRNNLACWRGEAGDAAAAATAYEELLADQVRVLGPDHPDTLTTRSYLAYWRGKAGDAAGAAAAYEEVLANQTQAQGVDQPETLATRHNLAHWRGKAGDATGAAAAFDTLLADRIRVQGVDHPDTLAARHNLAHFRGEAGDAAGAAAAFKELLADQIRVQGHDHPHTLAARNSLARWQGKAGDGR
ncbi:tetratricopeptide repeat protein [Streptomyces caniferus]|uniref:tetratricopeptide repeat protein n=1 Tax=Streptomyces caniferus TaxID=285557 RepID=UPI001FE419CF|nr:tetratricopeptide repeat protein [Streptomyces caniferus]